MTTETIDKLFLELSQVTQAKTGREVQLEQALWQHVRCLRTGDLLLHADYECTCDACPAVRDILERKE